MEDQKKSKAQLLEELDVLRSRVQELEQSEIELRECCEVYRTIFEMAPHLTSITRVNDGLYLQVNEAFCRLTGYSVEEAIGRTPFDLNLYPDPADRQRLLAAMQQGGRVDGMEIKFRRKNGAIIYDLVSARPYRFKGENCLLLMATEITSLKETEASLRESEEKYRLVVENAKEGILVAQDARIKFANTYLLQVLGYALNEIESRPFGDFVHPEDRDLVLQRHAQRQAGETVADEYEFRVIARDGSVHILDIRSVRVLWEGRPATLNMLADVTERRGNEEKYHDIIENMEEGYYEIDLAGNYTFLNEAVCRYHGRTREELIGMNNREYTTPEMAKEVFALFNEIYRTGTSAKRHDFDYQIIDKKGKTKHLKISASLIRDPAGKPIGFRGITRDVTEIKNMDAEKERLTQQLNQARKMEAIGTLAGGIAHDFNNLLMGIQGCTSLILLDLDPRHPHYEKLKAVEAQVKTGAELTRQLLGYARGGRYEVLPTNMNELLSKTSAVFGRMKKDIRIHHQFAQKLWLVEADRDQIEQVLMSLFMNASEAMPGGGTLFLETENVLLNEAVVRPYEIKLGPYVKISVTDTGVGMDEKTKERIFEPFFTTKEMGRGVGLGLVPAYGIIKGHGGLIEVFSEKGQGTTFIIYLPTFQKEVLKQEQPAKETTAGRETILLVDDEKIIINVVGSMISGLGYQLMVARSGEEAVELFRANPSRIDLVIMDMVMPGMGGGKAIDLIKVINPQARVILASGYSLEGEAKEIIDRGGAQLFLQKPFRINDLSEKIKQVLETRKTS